MGGLLPPPSPDNKVCEALRSTVFLRRASDDGSGTLVVAAARPAGRVDVPLKAADGIIPLLLLRDVAGTTGAERRSSEAPPPPIVGRPDIFHALVADDAWREARPRSREAAAALGATATARLPWGCCWGSSTMLPVLERLNGQGRSKTAPTAKGELQLMREVGVSG